MPCTHARSSLLRLPGRTTSLAARRLRSQFLEGAIDAEDFLSRNIHIIPKTKEQVFANQVKTYATASIVIDHFWNYLQEQPSHEIMAQLAREHAKGSHKERLIAFSAYCDALIDWHQKHFLEAERALYKARVRTEVLKSYLCFMAVARRRHKDLGGAPFPSMKDLPTLLVRMAHVVPEVFERDIGRAPTREEVALVLQHPSIARFFVEIMSNDRKATHPLIGLLETSLKIDLNNLRGTFDPQRFEIEEHEGRRSLHVKQEVIERHRRKHEKAASRRKNRGQPPREALGCPALYTGQFRSMYDWVLRLLIVWL